MTRHTIAMILFVMVAFFATGSGMAETNDPVRTAVRTNWETIPCIVTQVDSHLFASGAQVPVNAAIGRGNCTASPLVEERNGFVFSNPLWLSLDRWEGEWVRVHDWPTALQLGTDVRQHLLTYGGLEDGRYRLTVVNGRQPGPWYFLEAVHFTVGGVQESQVQALSAGVQRFDAGRRIPFVRSARVAMDGYLYFRGLLGNGVMFARGYLYQLTQERTVILPVEFEQVNPQDGSVFTNRLEVRGGTLDLPWVRVRLPNNNLDPTRPVFASVTADGGGITVQGVVFDPTDPAAVVAGFNASR